MKTLNTFVTFNAGHLQTKFNVLVEESKLGDFKRRMNIVLNLFNLEIKERATATTPSSSPAAYDETVVFDISSKNIHDISRLYFSPNGIFKLMIEVVKGVDKNLFENGDVINVVKACLDVNYSGNEPTNDIYHDFWVLSVKHAIARLENSELQVKINYTDKFKDVENIVPISEVNLATCIGVKVRGGLIGEAFEYFRDMFDITDERFVQLSGCIDSPTAIAETIKEHKRKYGIAKPVIVVPSNYEHIVDFINICRTSGCLGVIADCGTSTKYANFLPDYIFHIEKNSGSRLTITALRARNTATGVQVVI